MVLWKHLSFCLLHKIFYKFNNSIFCLHLLSFLGPDFLLIINLSQGNCFLFGAKQLFLILVFCLFFFLSINEYEFVCQGKETPVHDVLFISTYTAAKYKLHLEGQFLSIPKRTYWSAFAFANDRSLTLIHS